MFTNDSSILFTNDQPIIYQQPAYFLPTTPADCLPTTSLLFTNDSRRLFTLCQHGLLFTNDYLPYYWPQCWRNEVEHHSLQESDGVTCSMRQGAVRSKDKNRWDIQNMYGNSFWAKMIVAILA